MELLRGASKRIRARSESSSSSLNSALSAPVSSVFSTLSSPPSTPGTSLFGDDKFYSIGNLWIQRDAAVEPHEREAYNSRLLPLINKELTRAAYGEWFSVRLRSVGFQKGSFEPAILISTRKSKVKKKIFEHLASLEDLKASLAEYNLALHVVVNKICLSGGTSSDFDDAKADAYMIPYPGSKALCQSKIVIPRSGQLEPSICTGSVTLLAGDQLLGKSSRHPWNRHDEDMTDSEDDISSSDDDDDEDNGLALSLFPDDRVVPDTYDDDSSIFSDCSFDAYNLSASQTRKPRPQNAVHSHFLMEDDTAISRPSLHALGKVEPIYQSPEADLILYDPQKAAPNASLRDLAVNNIDGYEITKFHQEDPDAQLPVSIATHEGVVRGWTQPGEVLFQAGNETINLRLIILDYPLAVGCSGASVAFQNELCGTIQAISEDAPEAYMIPIATELKAMEAICGLRIRLPGSIEVDYMENELMETNVSIGLRQTNPELRSYDIIHSMWTNDSGANTSEKVYLTTPDSEMPIDRQHSSDDLTWIYHKRDHSVHSFEDFLRALSDLNSAQSETLSDHQDTVSRCLAECRVARRRLCKGLYFNSQATLAFSKAESETNNDSHVRRGYEYEDLVSPTFPATIGVLCQKIKQSFQDKHHPLGYIDTPSSVELFEAINWMVRWHQETIRCYVYLSIVPAAEELLSLDDLRKPPFSQNRWFTRGWTLQELVTPSSVERFSQKGKLGWRVLQELENTEDVQDSHLRPTIKQTPFEACDSVLKNREGRKMHEDQHQRCYICPVVNCKRRKAPFSAWKDLERHKKAVHLKAVERYRCKVLGCVKADSTWYSSKDFDRHFRRMHHGRSTCEPSLSGQLRYTEPDPGEEFKLRGQFDSGRRVHTIHSNFLVPGRVFSIVFSATPSAPSTTPAVNDEIYRSHLSTSVITDRSGNTMHPTFGAVRRVFSRMSPTIPSEPSRTPTMNDETYRQHLSTSALTEPQHANFIYLSSFLRDCVSEVQICLFLDQLDEHPDEAEIPDFYRWAYAYYTIVMQQLSSNMKLRGYEASRLKDGSSRDDAIFAWLANVEHSQEAEDEKC